MTCLNRSEPQFPKPAISRRGGQPIVMFVSQRLQPKAVPLKRNRMNLDHICHLLRVADVCNRPTCCEAGSQPAPIKASAMMMGTPSNQPAQVARTH